MPLIKNTTRSSLEILDIEFEREVYWNRFLERAGLIVGYGAYLVCFVIVFGLKLESVKYASLFYLGLFTRVSSLLIGKFYEIPIVFRNLFSENKTLVTLSIDYIRIYREKTFRRLAANLFGMNDSSTLYKANEEELLEMLRPKMQKPWKKAGKIYFFFIYIPIAFVLICISILM
ncbi:conserved membrane hypothetical protein [Leptospira interrogans serovar Manilae]|uniref:Uncharacterized protein n=1 Tax=Leptospira interrogans serovar Manilae TaxID=214675 RepID=A0AAQ1SP99_LEPIR|nr:hypothetical protein [Leptospira interrogans]AKP26418.1 hypothetical protein LIMLP_11015 [Leptospira interrogans serovar Manilae]AKP30202.1 hypothetical protein LIMHP_11025 [Leptospira interrogans serovar Manilae]EYU61710.1 hypothetical protein CI00_04095 [Leptospira interrogans serovar Manilae]SOR62079.1 conserved membrane hypothetical protein [Leptospira interrogans serovar Manilae]